MANTHKFPDWMHQATQSKEKNQSTKYKLSVIEEYYSPIAGKLLVTSNPILGKNVITEKMTSVSGDDVADVLTFAIRKVKNTNLKVKRCLILGFGVGKTAKTIHSLWKNCEITGVEIDPLMITIGREHFELTGGDANIIIGDAFKYKTKTKFDLIVTDIFIDNHIPKKFETSSFLRKVQYCLLPTGVVIFNRLYNTAVQKKKTMIFINKAKHLFNQAKMHTYKNNALIICSG